MGHSRSHKPQPIHFIIATMGLFSGDGAGMLARLLKNYGAIIVGGLHLKMPDSICDALQSFPIFNRKWIFTAIIFLQEFVDTKFCVPCTTKIYSCHYMSPTPNFALVGGLHLKMPDSICDEIVLKRSFKNNKRVVVKATEKICKAVRNIKNGKPPQEGLGIVYHLYFTGFFPDTQPPLSPIPFLLQCC